ncbi:hypothetical protein HNO88_003732 [Novosphingobium chloroacetimidivorans]|uniref:Uncharacterized protein n=1 Tax=Novosphingobium chloroacetimidivorans TaxID=1428314 RepID=A0A7W7NYF0_9SPHN|nr:DUF6771 family protein [Novosphingobium chloroacetimidivorans]MBB4860389.1 hypothetical protein [Novosphingobium chloroacetimidivorans]
MLINPETLADALETAPSWAKVALTMPSQRLREDARLEIGKHLYEVIYQPGEDDQQLALPL